ncbi:Inner membrane protein translocase component YidC, long form [Indibacter alkaliphilus LW1]|jgi:YidC/Oxa1 family membrane protein insertase|uniref:Membrane protein insertase YidC n=1 Tax=Indibacter alkaliphilus (strain CCUG 57479 / KCTC 22604 / LW1) TaxID=1189612 RepID=S2DJH8_INDAL|nr:membrane protein insertase YidC [Indibacter alkaliphilus]EOZ99087.1 Inner membrane protein translocase component YidC, long form [Indibacter alkaliphilus LW1]
MDRNQATGLILFAAVLLIYSLFFASAPEPLPQESTEAAQTALNDSEAANEIDQDVTEFMSEPDSLQDVRAQREFGVFAAMTRGQEEDIKIENDKMIVTFSTKGAEIKQVELKEFKTWDQRPLLLVESESSDLDYFIETDKGQLSLNQFYFNPTVSTMDMEGVDATVLTFIAQSGNGQIVRTYTLPEGGYILGKSLEFSGLERNLSSSDLKMVWDDRLLRQEQDLEESRRKTNINWYKTSGKHNDLSLSSDSDDDQINEPLKWVSFSQRFFTSGIIADRQFSSGIFEQQTPKDTLSVKNMRAELIIPIENGRVDLSYYFGPNNYNVLKKVTPGFEENVYMGYVFVSWVNKYIIVNLFQFLERYFSNYGIIIILIVLIIKAALFPLTYKSYMGMAKMRVIKPEIDELKAKYPDDPTKMQQEQMKLFGQLGVSPISGCLPMVFQMPFLFAMFFFFPNSIELRQESFLWAHDLSTYDSIINLPFTIPFYGAHVSLFTLLMTVSQIAYTHFNNQLTAQTGPMKNIGYIMPVIFMFVLNSFPAALSFYYFVSNMVTFGQQALIKLFVDDSKIREKIEENKKKNVNKKKSKFQQKLEDAMKAAEANRKK